MRALLFVAFAALLVGLTLAALLVGDGNLAVALAPALLAGALSACAVLPLRYPVLAVTFLALTLENPADAPAAGLWRSPLYPVGALLLTHLNVTFPAQRWLLFSGLDVVLVYLSAIALVRRLSGSRIDGGRSLRGAAPMRAFAWVSLGGAAWVWLFGVARGGADVGSSLWQVQRVVYLPLWFLLFDRAIAGRADRTALGRVVVASACVKAALAIYLRATLTPPPGMATIDYATTHTDSMLFAGACCVVVARLLQGGPRRCALVLPLVLGGMIANHRRTAWVELAAGLAVVALLAPPTRTKRAIARAAVLASPVAALYLAAGWGSTGGGFFAPVQVVRSVIDSKADMSTEWRDLENYDLFITLRGGPIFGSGYGHGYVEAVKLPDVSRAYALERFIPHNSVLGLWAYGGLVGFTALWSVVVVALFLAARAARCATAPEDRAAAIAACAAVAVYLVHCYGDMGLGTWTSVFTVAPAFAAASRLAVSTGAWPSRAAARRAPVHVVAVGPREDLPALAGAEEPS
jgi:hypothetical protein